MKLADLFTDIPVTVGPEPVPDVEIGGIAIDTRKVQVGDLFIAMKGGSFDAHDFIPDAVRRGAAAVIGDQELAGIPVPYIKVEDSRKALTWLAAAFYGHPGRKLTVIGVTGTDGKTTTSNLLYHILLAAGKRTGLISTVNAIIGEEVLDTGFHVTTPDAPDIQRMLAKMVTAGMTHVILETTSHGLSQHRVDACQYDLAVVTNITHEHLDEHGTFENYRAAKRRLFELLLETKEKPFGNPKLAVLNWDDTSYEYLYAFLRSRQGLVRVLSYGMDQAAACRAEEIRFEPSGTEFLITSPHGSGKIQTSLVGLFNVSNCLAAYSAAVEGLGVESQDAIRGIAAMPGVPGRMERMDLGQDFTAIVDFAHTPNALRVALETAREMLTTQTEDLETFSTHAVSSTQPRVIAIFGSAGLRDREKRRIMAEVSAKLADVTIMTAEDPRTESLEGILAEMAAGAQNKGAVEGEDFFRVPDRGDAIRFAVQMANKGDVIMACGKGHEQSMCFGTVEHPWDDCTAMRSALSERMKIPGPSMPVLPTRVS